MSGNDIQNSGVGSSESIDLKVVGMDEDVVHFRVKMNAKLGKIMEAYSVKVGVLVSSLRFVYDGDQINANDTPEQLAMENGDQIQAYR